MDLGFVSATGVTVVNPTKITGSIDLTGIPSGKYNVVVTNPDGKEGVLFNGFWVMNNSTGMSETGVYRPDVGFYLRWTTAAPGIHRQICI